MASLREIDTENPYSYERIVAAVDTLCRQTQHLRDEDKHRLYDALRVKPIDDEKEATLEHSLTELMRSQIRSAEALRAQYYYENGQLKPDVSGRDAKEALNACQSIITTLQKQMEKMNRQERLMRLERALITAGNTLEGEAKKIFLAQLKEILSEEA